MEKPKHKPKHALMEAIGFTEDDLEANREGRLSQDQSLRLARQTRLMLWSVIALAFVVLPISCVLPLIRSGMSDAVGYITVGLIAFVVAIFLTVKWGSKNRDYRGGLVQSVEGRIQLDVQTSGEANAFALRIENRAFKVNKRTFLAFKNGDPYVIYFMPSSKTIVSAEWLRED